jgi:hypothetical protein
MAATLSARQGDLRTSRFDRAVEMLDDGDDRAGAELAEAGLHDHPREPRPPNHLSRCAIRGLVESHEPIATPAGDWNSPAGDFVSRWIEPSDSEGEHAWRSCCRTSATGSGRHCVSAVFATIAILTLALGIVANPAIFSLLNPLIFRPLRVPNPARLCRVFSGRSGGNVYGRMAYPNYTDLRNDVQSVAPQAASPWPTPFTMGLTILQGGPTHSEDYPRRSP